MPFRRGIDKVNEIAQRPVFTGGGNRYFSWEDGETKIIRFLTDGPEIALTSLHEFISCSDGKKRSFVCRKEIKEECELCASDNADDAKTREQALAVAVWREEKEGGKIGTKVEEVDREEDGKTVTKVEPWVGIIRQSPRNFWGWFYDVFDKKGTLLDRDFSVTRHGVKTKTSYQSFPEDPSELDLSKFTEFMPDLEEFLSWMASQEFYDRFLHGIEPDSKEPEEDKAVSEDEVEKLEKLNKEKAATASSGSYD